MEDEQKKTLLKPQGYPEHQKTQTNNPPLHALHFNINEEQLQAQFDSTQANLSALQGFIQSFERKDVYQRLRGAKLLRMSIQSPLYSHLLWSDWRSTKKLLNGLFMGIHQDSHNFDKILQEIFQISIKMKNLFPKIFQHYKQQNMKTSETEAILESIQFHKQYNHCFSKVLFSRFCDNLSFKQSIQELRLSILLLSQLQQRPQLNCLKIIRMIRNLILNRIDYEDNQQTRLFTEMLCQIHAKLAQEPSRESQITEMIELIRQRTPHE